MDALEPGKAHVVAGRPQKQIKTLSSTCSRCQSEFTRNCTAEATYLGYDDETCRPGVNLMKPVFLQLQCFPGKTYEVAAALFEREIVSELYSTSGDYDLLMKIYIPEEQDVGKFINDNVLDIPGIARSLTTMTFTAF